MTKYETPKLTALPPAINAIQGTATSTKGSPSVLDFYAPHDENEMIGTYADWE